MTAVRVERLEPYLRPDQVNALLDEKNGIERTLGGPAHIVNKISDKGGMRKQMQHIERTLHKDTPKPYAEAELDRAVRREVELRDTIVSAMPTQAEMRRCPPGAVDKERGFQKRCKSDILEWKNLRRRLHSSGMIDKHPDAREVANLEQFRPVHASHELNMDNSVVTGAGLVSFPNGPIPIRNVMSDEEREAERESRNEWVAKIAAEAAVQATLTMAKLLGIEPTAATASASAPAGKTKN